MKKGAKQMLKGIGRLVTGVVKRKVCQRCGAGDRVKRVYVSNFFGHGSFIPLCPRCRALEAMIRY